MPYTIIRTHQNRHVAEAEYAVATSVAFTPITSCLVIAGREGNGRIVGVHLVIIDGQGNVFDNAAAQVAGGLLAACRQHLMIGSIGSWRHPANGVGAAFNALAGQYQYRQVDVAAAPRLRLFSRFGYLRYRTGNGCLG